MHRMKAKQWLFVSILLNTSLSCFSQQQDSARFVHHFSGSAGVTNNGISLVPNFSLGRPAALFLLSLGGERFSIDPDIRFALDGKPWTFLFWARYKLFTEGKFRMNAGAHLGLNFKTGTLPVSGTQAELTVVRRYLAGELVPNYFVARNISIGAYYLYSRGLDNGTVRNTHFVTLNSNFSHIPLVKQVYLRIAPQIYFLDQDGRNGQYVMATFTLAKNNFPLSLSSILNKSIRSGILGSRNFNSNLSLVYSFSRYYAPKLPVP